MKKQGVETMVVTHSPPSWRIHAALACSALLSGGGAVIGKLGLSGSVNPVVFGLYREAITGPILVLLAYFFHKKLDFLTVRNLGWFFLAGALLFGNQILYIVGLSACDPNLAAMLQPSQPIFTMIFAVLLKMEKMSLWKALGILAATCGATTMVLFSNGGSVSFNFAALYFIGNCMCSAGCLLACKPLLRVIPSMWVTAICYLCAASCMFCVSTQYLSTPHVWLLPSEAFYALIYFVICQSILAYLLLMWANQFVPGSVASAYTTLQPLAAAVLSAIIFSHTPSVGDLGGIGILLGLFCVAMDNRYSTRKIKLTTLCHAEAEDQALSVVLLPSSEELVEDPEQFAAKEFKQL
eukprot:GILK01004494.1.p1 GENE.GILK01004494.1~~GILK01004494.1.p1  ORF type:complete len:361 (+),score=37.47 GILK01004494.1:30-1085(+)